MMIPVTWGPSRFRSAIIIVYYQFAIALLFYIFVAFVCFGEEQPQGIKQVVNAFIIQNFVDSGFADIEYTQWNLL
jgi:hypothetical protein